MALKMFSSTLLWKTDCGKQEALFHMNGTLSLHSQGIHTLIHINPDFKTHLEYICATHLSEMQAPYPNMKFNKFRQKPTWLYNTVKCVMQKKKHKKKGF